MPNIGPMELAVILVVALLVLGPKRLPEAGRALGRSINEFRDGLSLRRNDQPRLEAQAREHASEPARELPDRRVSVRGAEHIRPRLV